MGTQDAVASTLGSALQIRADQWKQRFGRRSALEPPLGQSYPMYRRGGVCHPIGRWCGPGGVKELPHRQDFLPLAGPLP